MTPNPVIDEHDVTVHLGDVREQLALLDAGSVQCVVTSPPYYGLRDYGNEQQDWPRVEFVPMAGLPPTSVPAMRCSLGLEPSPWAFVAHMVLVFRAARRVLADDGVLWLNLGDSYSTRVAARPSSHQDGLNGEDYGKNWKRDKAQGLTRMPTFLPEKNLFGVPWRVAFALQADGWILRNDNIWNKPNGMPDSVRDRLSNKHEHLFLFSKSRRYTFDLDAIKVPTSGLKPGNTAAGMIRYGEQTGTDSGARRFGGNATSTLLDVHETKNPGDVWTIAPQPFPGAHFATFPVEIPRRCILAGCPEDGTVLDPFTGSGTTAMVSRRLGRRFVGVELNPDYIPIIRDRIGPEPFDFAAGSEATA